MADKRLQRIMAEDERLFKAMQPGQKGKGASSIRGSEKPASKATKKKPKRKVSNGVSQFDVLAFGVVDAIQRAMAPVSSPAREAIEEVETSSDAKQGSQVGASTETFISSGYRGKEDKADAATDAESLKDRRDPGLDNSLENPFKELPDDSVLDEHIPASFNDAATNRFPELLGDDRKVYFRDYDHDVGEAAADMSLGQENNLGPNGIRYDYRTDNLPENPFKELPEEESEDDESDVNPLIQKRRDRAQRERQAAAKNFQEQHQAPILGIPNPVPMLHADQDHRVDMAVNEDEVALAIDETANTASALMRNLVDLMDKFSEEMQALSVRVRNIELVLDRL